MIGEEIYELKNIIERAVILCEGDVLTSDLIPLEISDCISSPILIQRHWQQ